LKESPLSAIPPSWAEVFWRNVEHKKLSRALISGAVAVLDFDLSKGRPVAADEARVEYPFALRVEIRDDKGRAYAGSSEAWCFPHDPKVELKSARGA